MEEKHTYLFNTGVFVQKGRAKGKKLITNTSEQDNE